MTEATHHHKLNHRFNRRRLLQCIAGATLLSTGTFGYARTLEPRWLDIERVTLPVQWLAERLSGRTIAHLSDIHLSEYTAPEQLARTVTAANKLQPDWVLLTGDFVGADISYAQHLVEPLRQLNAPTYAVMGNHDLWSGVSTVMRYLDESAVTVLRNDSVQLEHDLWLSGFDDVWRGRPDPKAALHNVPPESTTLLMVHEPDYFDTVHALDIPIVAQFSGHSHGGQVRFPRSPTATGKPRTWAPILPRYGTKYPLGFYQQNNRMLYTNRGLGVWPLPYRFNCRPELTLFTLVPA